MCKTITLPRPVPAKPDYLLALMRPVVACETCGGPVFVDGCDVLCLDCPLPFEIVPEAAAGATR